MPEHAPALSAEQLQDVRARARHARQRYDLYKAKAYGSRPTSAARLRELQRECEAAEERLRAAEALQRAAARGPHSAH